MGGESIKGPWGSGGTAPPLPTVPELEQLRGQVAALREEFAQVREAERALRRRCHRSELAASRAADVLRELAPVLRSTVRALAAATTDVQLHAAEDVGELPF